MQRDYYSHSNNKDDNVEDFRRTNQLVSSVIAQSRHSRIIEKARSFVNQNVSRPFTPRQSKRRISERNESDIPLVFSRKLKGLSLNQSPQVIKYSESKDESKEEEKNENFDSGLTLILKQLKKCTRPETQEEVFWDDMWSKVDNHCAMIESKDEPSLCESHHFVILETVWPLILGFAESHDFLDENNLNVVSVGRTCLRLSRICLRCCLPAFDQQIMTLISYLQNTCKMLFKMAKNKLFDNIFREEYLLDTLLSLVSRQVNENPGKLQLYVFGCIKFLSDNGTNQRALAQLGAVGRLSDIMKGLVKTRPKAVLEERLVSQILVLVLATLRNLALDKRHMKQFWAYDVTRETCTCVVTYHGDPELMLNCVRVLSKLSIFTEGRAAIYASNGVQSLSALLRDYHDFEIALTIRALFVLGNLTAGSSACRITMGKNSSIEMLISMLAKYTDEYTSSDHNDTDFEEKRSLLVKLARLLANLAIDEELGPEIASQSGIESLVALLDHNHKKKELRTELNFNLLSSITNLSFYFNKEDQIVEGTTENTTASKGSKNIILESYVKILPLLVPFLFDSKEEYVSEAVRAVANFSRDCKTHGLIERMQIDSAIIILVDHVNQDIVYDACGVLTNIAAYDRCIGKINEEKVAGKIIKLLRQNSLNSPGFATICCMALHNYLTHCNEPTLQDDEYVLLQRTLDELVDVVKDLEKGDIWEDFINVSTALLKLLL